MGARCAFSSGGGRGPSDRIVCSQWVMHTCVVWWLMISWSAMEAVAIEGGILGSSVSSVVNNVILKSVIMMFFSGT